jgi:hypothetical protein
MNKLKEKDPTKTDDKTLHVFRKAQGNLEEDVIPGSRVPHETLQPTMQKAKF